MAENFIVGLTIKAKDAASEALKKVRAGIGALDSSAVKASKSTKEMSKGLDSAAKAANPLEKALQGAKNQLIGLLGVVGLTQLGRGVAGAADQWKLYTAQLKLATDSAEEQAKAESALFQISQDTRTELQSNITLYSRLAASRKDLGLEQEDLLELTNLTAQALSISGASTAEAASVTTQLSQALASGVLRGDEFNSIMENGGRVATALGDALGLSTGELRALAGAGELTAKKVTEALLSQKDAIATEYAELPVTIEGSITRLVNAWQKYIGEVDTAAGASTKVADALSKVAENFDEVADAAVTIGQVIVATFAIKGAAALRTYVVEMSVATAATKGLTASTVAQGAASAASAAKVSKFTSALNAVGWAAAITGAAHLITRFNTLRDESNKTADAMRANADAFVVGTSTVELYAAAIEQGSTDVGEFVKQVRDGNRVFDEATGKWTLTAEALKTMANTAAEAAKKVQEAKDSFETDETVKNSFFVQLMSELQTLSSEGVPDFITKMSDLRTANLLTDGQVNALRLTLVALQEQIEDTGGEVKVVIKKEVKDGITEFSDGLDGVYRSTEKAAAGTKKLGEETKAAGKETKEDIDITKLSVDGYIEYRKAKRAAAEASSEQSAAAKEAGDATEAGAEQMGGAASAAAQMVEWVSILRERLSSLSPAAVEAFNVAISGGADGALAPADLLQEKIADLGDELLRIRTLQFEHAGNPFAQWFLDTAKAAAEVERAFLKEAQSAEALLNRLADVENGSVGLVDQAQAALGGFQLLDEATLSNLESEINRVAAANESMIDSAERLFEKYQDQADPEGSEARTIARERAALEEKYQAAVAAGNLEAQRLLREAIEFQRQAHAETMGQLEDEEDARRDAWYPDAPLTTLPAQAQSLNSTPVNRAGITTSHTTIVAPTEDFLARLGDILEGWRPPVPLITLDGEAITKRVEANMRRQGGMVAETSIAEASTALGHRI